MRCRQLKADGASEGTLEVVTRAITMLTINNKPNQDYIRCDHCPSTQLFSWRGVQCAWLNMQPSTVGLSVNRAWLPMHVLLHHIRCPSDDASCRIGTCRRAGRWTA